MNQRVQSNFLNHYNKFFCYFLNEKYNLISLHWGKWAIDVLGVGYPIDKRSINFLKQSFKKIKMQREDIKNISVNDIIISALLGETEIAYKNENFALTLTLISRILRYIY